ncbi:hypothetical protein CDN99_22675 [Roseateles aquatilis]|uniref:Response regulatory domain-containing protein n=1 Tax=Roseateles aquatilis TaxID=431061 RepID=A0A2D0AM76_9BURK|nr:hypothetical protein [Roseateles aquatilis]OWQ85337.1 hypothetical protein CDN99_22675 [Roseateles aquatilis]
MSSPPPSIAAPLAANDMVPRPSDSQWGDIVQQLGAEIAGPLSGALERIQQLISTGQIDRQGLRALRDAVAQAREAGMVSQQLARLASGRLRLSRERIHLTQVLRGVLTQRSRETQARGIQVRQLLQPVEIMTDASLLFSLLNAVMDWALASTHSSLEMRLDLTPWPAKARLMCRFAHRSLDLGSAPAHAIAEAPEALNSLTWRLIEQTAITMGVLPLREDEAGITMLTLEFPHLIGDEPGAQTGAQPLPRPDRPELDDPAPSHNSKPLAGCHLLIVSPRREVRQEIQASVRHMGLIIDAVSSMEEAMQFCEEGLPHGIAFEQSLRDADFDRLRADITAEVPNFSFIEVMDGEQQTQLSTATADHMARISRGNLPDALPSVLLFELSKAL